MPVSQNTLPSAYTWPIPMAERARLALAHEPEASASPPGFRLATCVVPSCKRPMVAMWHLWLDVADVKPGPKPGDKLVTRYVKEIHMCHACATDIYGAPESPDGLDPTKVWISDDYGRPWTSDA